MELYQRLARLAHASQSPMDQATLLEAADRLTPPALKLQTKIAPHLGPVVLVAELIDRLCLEKSQCVPMGKALAQLGYRKETVHFDRKPYGVWTKDCSWPKGDLYRLLKAWEKRKKERFLPPQILLLPPVSPFGGEQLARPGEGG